jgi:voltage-gated potassium channel
VFIRLSCRVVSVPSINRHQRTLSNSASLEFVFLVREILRFSGATLMCLVCRYFSPPVALARFKGQDLILDEPGVLMDNNVRQSITTNAVCGFCMQQLNESERLGMFQIAVLVLSIVLLLCFVADSFLTLPAELSRLFQTVDTAICVVFLGDFCVRLSRAEDKRNFMKWGWIDLIASIPNLDVLRWGRMIRILRVIRILRGLRSIQRVLLILTKKKIETGAVSLALSAFLLIVFSASSILVVEQHDSANIKTAEDAVWWAVSTITTVGYGDKYPVTSEGRVLGMLLMITGVGMFGGLSGLIASMFLEGRNRNSQDLIEVIKRLEQMDAKLDRLPKAQPESKGGSKDQFPYGR